MLCQVCGQENAADEKICWKCGAVKASQQAELAGNTINCPECNGLNNSASFFCYNCGCYFAGGDDLPAKGTEQAGEGQAPRARLVLPGTAEIALAGIPTFVERSDFNGRLPQDIVMSISRQHMLITYEKGTYYVQDYGRDGTGSTNHTRLNMVDIHHKGRQALKDGDQIELARQPLATLTFQII